MIAFYNELAEYLPSPRLIFLNYGIAEPDESCYAWIRPGDRIHKYHLSLVRRVLDGVGLEGKSILEIGSGRGGNCYYLDRYTRARQIYGLDLCEANVRFCLRAYPGTRVRFLRGDSQDLPLADASLDVVLNLESSHCYADFGRFLAEVWRVLKPGGVFAYADFWYLNILPLDWQARRQTLLASPFQLLAEEDITWQVSRALKDGDGLSRSLLAMENRRNSAFVRHVVQCNRAMRLTLASGQCRYNIWKFRKPSVQPAPPAPSAENWKGVP